MGLFTKCCETARLREALAKSEANAANGWDSYRTVWDREQKVLRKVTALQEQVEALAVANKKLGEEKKMLADQFRGVKDAIIAFVRLTRGPTPRG